MSEYGFNNVMDELYTVLSQTPIEDSVTRLVRCAAHVDNVQAFHALATLLMIENTRRRHAEVRYEELRKTVEDAQ